MKKILLLIIASFTIFSVNAQSKWGIKAGLNFKDMSDISFQSKDFGFSNRTKWHTGLMFQARVPLIGLAFQPELIYTSKGVRPLDPTNNPVRSEFSIDYIELPVNIQWGINLLLLRPYIQVSPYVCYALKKDGFLKDMDWCNLNEWDYGIGLGAGVEVWRLQISGKYSWSLIETIKSFEDITMDNLKYGKIRGFELSVGFLF